MEKVSILCFLDSDYGFFLISSAQSAMFAFARIWIEIIGSLPSADYADVAVCRVIEKYLTERQMIVSGLRSFTLRASSSYNQSYWLICLGLSLDGIGLLNAKAILIVSERIRTVGTRSAFVDRGSQK